MTNVVCPHPKEKMRFLYWGTKHDEEGGVSGAVYRCGECEALLWRRVKGK